MPQHLIVTAFWVEAEDGSEATERVAEAIKGTAIPNSGAIVSLLPRDVGTLSLKRDLARFQLVAAWNFGRKLAMKKAAAS